MGSAGKIETWRVYITYTYQETMNVGGNYYMNLLTRSLILSIMSNFCCKSSECGQTNL